ncbi:transposase InsK IS150 [Streptococcus pneumoniae]|nr:transposase InsK IS150 [Streptococcus pneumoniae]
MVESFFGILKSEMFYGYEQTFKSLNQLEQAIIDYIDYYNNKRIKVKLKGLSSCSTELNPSDKLIV